MAKLKVLHIIKSLGRGGAEMLLPETLKLHDHSSFEFHYIYFLPWKDQMVDAITNEGGKVICFPASNNLKLLLQLNKVVNYINENKIDIIHCHLPWSGFIGRIAHNKTKVPLIYTEHNIQERYHWATKFLNKISFNLQTLALGVSADVSRSINEKIAPRIPVETLLNGVNTEHFKRNNRKGHQIKSKFEIPESAIVIGNIAVFREQKDISTWLKAFKIINREYPEVYGLLVGAGPKEEEINKEIHLLGLENKIKLPGLQTDTVPYFSAMDIFMMSSQFEGLPIALLEAMSMSCAIVSTSAGGVVEVIRNGKDGLLSEVGDDRTLANNVLNLIKDHSLRGNYQQNSRSRAEHSFSLGRMVEVLESYYSNVANIG